MAQEVKPEKKGFQGTRSIKRLKSSLEATALHREYTKKMWEDIAKGEPYVFGYGPMELFNSMGLYQVLPVTYGALLSAKQMYSYYQGKFEEQGYFSSLSNYESLPLGYCFDNNPEIAPYGGLLKPSAIIAGYVTEIATYELYAREFGVPIFFMEDPMRQAKIPSRWWDGREFRESYITDFVGKEVEYCVRFLESVTGKTFSDTKLRETLIRADEMAELYWKISDLANTTIPAPITCTDIFSEVAIYETHFGEEWALEHVKKMYAEVKERVDNKEAAVPNEKIRILWSSMPPWFNLGFFNYWEESHGAVFLTDTYLARGQRMIERDRRNPLKTSFLRRHMKYSGSSPMAAAEVVINKALQYKCDGVIVPKRGASRDLAANSLFVEKYLEREGIPVLSLDFQPLNSNLWDDDKIKSSVTEFIESLKPRR